MKNRKIFAILLALALVLTTAVGCASGGDNGGQTAGEEQKQIDFPTKSIDMTILFGAGAGADVMGRTLADLVSKDLGQPVVCNNRVGGGGAVGYQYVLNTPADGYNIVWNSTSVSVVYHQGNMEHPYDAFRGVANITQEAVALAIRADDDRWNTIEEFIAYAKEHPGEVTVANSGIGSFNHLMAAAIGNVAGVDLKHIPMDAKQSTTSLLGGQVDAIVNMAFDVIQQQEAGTMKALVVVAPERLEKLPDVPTMKEKGYDLDLMMYRGIAVPKDTPDEVVKVLEEAFMKAGQSAEFKEFAEKFGAIVDVRNAADFDSLMADNDKIVADIMESIGIKKQ
ncbi:MAG: tripartite tricarboxylate transporter substrate binding protein [Peptococcaceae bacterium]|jgi:tripartite-type tricarboxylate transporter receptor subunit TctC|nr:tripartite tricarboxylate transporter substrate binding protein [Peptococcaceae bacterium]